jgi:Cd2+/Zn2+-exporting ATPase
LRSLRGEGGRSGKAVFLITTVIGVAILADTGATVLVTMNALRLLDRPSS